MKLTRDQVKHVAKLAGLPLSKEEETKYSDQLSKILDYVEILNRADILLGEKPTYWVEPTFNVAGKSNVMREDETSPSLPPKGGLYTTKGVFENE